MCNLYSIRTSRAPLVREAALSGDDIAMENCCQHAEHYFRVINNRG